MTNDATENDCKYCFTLEYQLLINNYDSTFGNIPYYGLKLEKFVNSLCCESVQISDISTDKEQVLALKDTLNRNMVTPTTFFDIVEDWINLKYSI